MVNRFAREIPSPIFLSLMNDQKSRNVEIKGAHLKVSFLLVQINGPWRGVRQPLFIVFGPMIMIVT